MDISLLYRRIPAQLLHHYIDTANTVAAAAYLHADHGHFPYSIQHFELLDYTLLPNVLDPSLNRETPVWMVTRGAVPFEATLDRGDEQYLEQVPYIAPEQVTQIAAHLRTIDWRQFLINVAAVKRISEDDLFAGRYPDGREIAALHDQFLQILCFFQIAAEVGDGILWAYSG